MSTKRNPIRRTKSLTSPRRDGLKMTDLMVLAPLFGFESPFELEDFIQEQGAKAIIKDFESGRRVV